MQRRVGQESQVPVSLGSVSDRSHVSSGRLVPLFTTECMDRFAGFVYLRFTGWSTLQYSLETGSKTVTRCLQWDISL